MLLALLPALLLSIPNMFLTYGGLVSDKQGNLLAVHIARDMSLVIGKQDAKLCAVKQMKS